MKLPYKPLNNRGLTLVECLISLMITGLIMYTLTSCLILYRRSIELQQTDHTSQWHGFLILLEEELQQFTIDAVSSQHIRLVNKQTPTQHFDIVLHNQKIYKRPGHHPFLYEVADWSIDYHAPHLHIALTFTNQQTFQATLTQGGEAHAP